MPVPHDSSLFSFYGAAGEEGKHAGWFGHWTCWPLCNILTVTGSLLLRLGFDGGFSMALPLTASLLLTPGLTLASLTVL